MLHSQMERGVSVNREKIFAKRTSWEAMNKNNYHSGHTLKTIIIGALEPYWARMRRYLSWHVKNLCGDESTKVSIDDITKYLERPISLASFAFHHIFSAYKVDQSATRPPQEISDVAIPMKLKVSLKNAFSKFLSAFDPDRVRRYGKDMSIFCEPNKANDFQAKPTFAIPPAVPVLFEFPTSEYAKHMFQELISMLPEHKRDDSKLLAKCNMVEMPENVKSARKIVTACVSYIVKLIK